MTINGLFKLLSSCNAVIANKDNNDITYIWIHISKKSILEDIAQNQFYHFNNGYFLTNRSKYKIIYNAMTPIDFKEKSRIINDVHFPVMSDFQVKLYDTLCNDSKDLRFITNDIEQFYNMIYCRKLSNVENSLLKYVKDKDIASLQSKNIIDYLKRMYVTYADNNALSDFIKYIIEHLLAIDSEFVSEFDNATYIYPKEFQEIANASSKRYWKIKLTGLKSIRISHRNISLKIIVYDDITNTTHIDLFDLYSYKYNVYSNNVEITIEKNI
ncbi:MAG TPA: hypothetical protein PKD00_03325 [Burkholderiales bacterium]|nr:hypothetical protein [Burkholderiales bacterium]